MRILRFAALAAVITAAAATPAAAAGASSVGHQVKDLTVSGSGGNEPRPVKVHLWYPATEPAARVPRGPRAPLGPAGLDL
jgi:hypothetical protein